MSSGGIRQANATSEDSKVGVIVATHCDLAKELLRAAKLIVGSLEGFYAITITPDMKTEDITELFSRMIKEADSGRGVLILTDIYGGTPTNIALSFSGNTVDVVCGVNLPMLIKAYSCRKHGCSLEDMARIVQDYGRSHITRANEILPPDAE
ncbi:PTS sugar transporter subunit IIA [Thermodesulforhabdus norvegica]|uniref:PTS system, mannose-specific IIA component n=1 Tax=Thermodesulforhabdus norvegica TaxID=39841 RepID=A0A1I4VJF2_9BACT|nr:PTS sugar transporter subunit IIA [Thermodesulforhabdus norvegica]SFN01289.1 PTS system, mannose-specific IIA component [Thermodesulforhabdus norvegica]